MAKLIGASVWEVQLYEHLDSHEHRERGRLAQYQQAATDSESPAFRYLASLIIEDEIRHHRMFRDLAAALQAEAELRPDQPAVPRLEQWGADPLRVVELSERLLAEERADAEELHRLCGEFEGIEGYDVVAAPGRTHGDGHGQAHTNSGLRAASRQQSGRIVGAGCAASST